MIRTTFENYIHGHCINRKSTKTYKTWRNMLGRCYDKNFAGYDNYGGRGIKVDKQWMNFENFLSDMGESPKQMSLGRIDNNKGYFKENCRWETRLQQSRNKRVQSNNKLGIMGVFFDKKRHKFEAFFVENRIKKTLYYGKSFFEACCARKSWEAKYCFNYRDLRGDK